MPRLIGRAAKAGDPLPPAVSVESWRAKLVLARAGLLDVAEHAVALYGNPEARAYWTKPTWRLDHWLVAGIAFLLNLDSAQVADLFEQALTAE